MSVKKLSSPLPQHENIYAKAVDIGSSEEIPFPNICRVMRPEATYRVMVRVPKPVSQVFT
jgi:hypothetical protein